MTEPQEDALTRSIVIAWEAFRRCWWLLVVATLALLVANVPGVVVGQVGQFVHNVLQNRGAGIPAYIVLWGAVAAVSVVLGVALQWPIQVGATLAAIQGSRGRTGDFGAIIAPYRRLLPLALATILVTVLNFVAVLPGLAIAGLSAVAVFGPSPRLPLPLGIAGMIVGALVAMFVALWLSARLLPTLPRVVDPLLPALGPVDSIAAAWRATRGHALAGVGIQLLAGAVVFLSVFCCCVGVLLVGVPAYLALVAGFYRTMFAADEAPFLPPSPPPPPAWSGDTPPRSPV
jgi:hypothetical protein